MNKLLAGTRIVLVTIVMAYYLSILLFKNLVLGRSVARGFKYRRSFIDVAFKILGIRMHVSGAAPNDTCLYVCNHRSLIDPVLCLRDIRAFVVSKAEVERYPVIGSGAKATGVIFVHRDKQHSRAAAKKAIQDALESGKSVMLYPEGTTSDLDTTNEFKLGSFKVAAETGYPVVPVAIDYKDPADYWFGTPMLAHFMKKFGKRKTYSSLKIGPLLHGDNALELMRESRGWINNSILEMRANWRNDPG